MFKSVRLYIRIARNQVEVTNLETGETISRKALNDFSSIRNIVGNFNNAKETICSAIKELGLKTFLGMSRFKILIQQLEGTMAEGGIVFLLDHTNPLTVDDALRELQSKS